MKNSSCFVAKVDITLAEKMQNDLTEQGFTISVPVYTLFSAQKKGVVCTLYKSGKLIVQGKEMEAFITFYLEPEILKDLTYSYPQLHVNFSPHIGVDEAGKGDFFGPLCVAAVYGNEEMIQKMLELRVRDSKNIGDPTILKMAKVIKEICPYTIVRILPEKYNELYQSFKNLNSLLGWGHATAIFELTQKTDCKEVIIDQFASEHVVLSALAKKGLKVNLKQRFKAEEDLVVAAASILARAAFLQGMDQLSSEFSIELPKGASERVVDAGKRFVFTHGAEALKKVAKLHFKLREMVLENA